MSANPGGYVTHVVIPGGNVNFISVCHAVHAFLVSSVSVDLKRKFKLKQPRNYANFYQRKH